MLLAALVAIVVLAVHGLASVNAANGQVFGDNLRTSQDTSTVAIDLGRAQTMLLEIASAPGAGRDDQLRVELQQSVVPRVDAAITALVAIHAGDPPAEHAQIERIPRAWNAVIATLESDRVLSGALPVLTASELSGARRAATTMLGPLVALVSARQSIEATAASQAHVSAEQTYKDSRLWLIVAAALSVLAAASMVRLGLMLRRLLDAQDEEQQHAQSAGEYSELLQATASEDEAHELLRRQVERVSDDAAALVLARNNSDDRLEPRTALERLPELRGPLEHASPRSCLAVRFARSHIEGGARSPLTNCELCGRLSGVTTCEPLLVSGQVIGAVLVSHRGEPEARSCNRIRETVAQAAPVLGNLRNLAIAELRAATDRLTGLPNQRAVQDTLKRMVAQASRTITPLSAVLVDLDHFKKINDLHGHDRGDEALAAVGVALRSALRESDFVGRYGGEEFLILLPATDAPGALHVAEAVRTAIAAIRLPRLEQITASAGIATLPDHAGDALTLFRAADRALYTAKSNGRDQTHTPDEESLQPVTKNAPE
ncbi:MAG TPA: GGDEF domain-containing protein [Solirubrobacteraceae bacterium]|jgi:diguanylate cyclase (GGDEF)-like protein